MTRVHGLARHIFSYSIWLRVPHFFYYEIFLTMNNNNWTCLMSFSAPFSLIVLALDFLLQVFFLSTPDCWVSIYMWFPFRSSLSTRRFLVSDNTSSVPSFGGVADCQRIRWILPQKVGAQPSSLTLPAPPWTTSSTPPQLRLHRHLQPPHQSRPHRPCLPTILARKETSWACLVQAPPLLAHPPIQPPPWPILRVGWPHHQAPLSSSPIVSQSQAPWSLILLETCLERGTSQAQHPQRRKHPSQRSTSTRVTRPRKSPRCRVSRKQKCRQWKRRRPRLNRPRGSGRGGPSPSQRQAAKRIFWKRGRRSPAKKVSEVKKLRFFKILSMTTCWNLSSKILLISIFTSGISFFCGGEWEVQNV